MIVLSCLVWIRLNTPGGVKREGFVCAHEILNYSKWSFSCALRGFRHYRYQHRCHKAEQTKNNSASTRLHAIPCACFAGRKRDANLKCVHDAENNLLFLPPWWFWRTSDLTLAIKEIRYVSHKRWKVCHEGASFNNLIPFKSSTEPLDKDD